MPTTTTSRRSFIHTTALSALAVGALAACDRPAPGASQGAATKGPPTGGTMGPHDTSTGAPSLSASDQMDAMHEKGVKDAESEHGMFGKVTALVVK